MSFKKIIKYISVVVLLSFAINSALPLSNEIASTNSIEVSQDTNPFVTSIQNHIKSKGNKIAFIVAGQSNVLSWVETGADRPETWNSKTKQLGRYSPNFNVLIDATSPLEHYDYYETADWKGISMGFENRLLEVYPNKEIAFIPCGDAGTSFRYNHWNKDDVNYLDMVSRTNYFIANYPDYEVVGMIWHQGEGDKGQPELYEGKFDQFITDWRADITGGANIPMIIGGLLPYNVDNTEGADEIDAIIRDTPNRQSNVYFADPSIPTILTGRDYQHFDSASSIEFGRRYADVFINNQ